MALNKHELDLEKLRIRARITGARLDLAKVIAQLFAALVFSYLLFECVKSIVTANPDGIRAVADLIKNMSLDRIFMFFLSAGCAVGWRLERSGKKRLLNDYAIRRNMTEMHDAYAASSGLTTSGDTPR